MALLKNLLVNGPAPIVVVKKDGANHICVDYRRLNAFTKCDAYPMPRIDEMLDAVRKARYITTLDLAKGYWQVPLHDTDREKTAFTRGPRDFPKTHGQSISWIGKLRGNVPRRYHHLQQHMG